MEKRATLLIQRVTNNIASRSRMVRESVWQSVCLYVYICAMFVYVYVFMFISMSIQIYVYIFMHIYA